MVEENDKIEIICLFFFSVNKSQENLNKTIGKILMSLKHCFLKIEWFSSPGAKSK